MNDMAYIWNLKYKVRYIKSIVKEYITFKYLGSKQPLNAELFKYMIFTDYQI